jgi:endoglucanase
MRLRHFILILNGLLAVSASAQPTARQWNSEVKCGWNLGNQLECPASGQDNESVTIGCPANALQAETAWGNPVVTKAMIDAVKEAGFNAVRIPVRWQHHITDTQAMTIDEAWLNRVKEVVGYCLDNDMKVIVNTHHDKWLESRPTYTYKEENNRRLSLLWTQIAIAFADYDYRLAFAGTNEVHIPNNWNAPTTENLAVQNSYNQTFVDAVRAIGGNNLKRHLIVQTYNCNLEFGLANGGFIIPNDIADNGYNYMSVELHYYTPWDYCGGATAYYWGEAYKNHSTVSPSNEQNLRHDLQRAADAWTSQGLGIVIGEWGVTNHWDKGTNMNVIHANMTYYCRTLVSEARQHGFSLFVWDNNSFGNGEEQFGIFDRKNGMAVRADWILKGIREGIATGINSPHSIGKTDLSARLCLEKDRLVVRKGDKVYTLGGMEIQR